MEHPPGPLHKGEVGVFKQIKIINQMKNEMTFIQLLDWMNHVLDAEIAKKVQ